MPKRFHMDVAVMSVSDYARKNIGARASAPICLYVTPLIKQAICAQRLV